MRVLHKQIDTAPVKAAAICQLGDQHIGSRLIIDRHLSHHQQHCHHYRNRHYHQHHHRHHRKNMQIDAIVTLFTYLLQLVSLPAQNLSQRSQFMLEVAGGLGNQVIEKGHISKYWMVRR